MLLLQTADELFLVVTEQLEFDGDAEDRLDVDSDNRVPADDLVPPADDLVSADNDDLVPAADDLVLAGASAELISSISASKSFTCK